MLLSIYFHAGFVRQNEDSGIKCYAPIDTRKSEYSPCTAWNPRFLIFAGVFLISPDPKIQRIISLLRPVATKSKKQTEKRQDTNRYNK
jgi:hypothetical protein